MDPLSTSDADPCCNPLASADLFKQFLNERRYLKNVTGDTIEWYHTAWKAFQRTLNKTAPPITKTSLQGFVVAMRQRGVKPISVNTYIKALNAFCRWLHEEGHHRERLQLPLLKLEKRVLQTLTDEQIRTLVGRKPKGLEATRLHTLISFALDTGVRIEEALRARVSNVDYDNLLVTVLGNQCWQTKRLVSRRRGSRRWSCRLLTLS